VRGSPPARWRGRGRDRPIRSHGLPPGDPSPVRKRLGRKRCAYERKMRTHEGSEMERHPITKSWALPPSDRAPLPAPLLRTNVRALAARPGRFEHHLVVVARIGAAQLEQATASEPLYFAHANVSDEYALPLTTG